MNLLYSLQRNSPIEAVSTELRLIKNALDHRWQEWTCLCAFSDSSLGHYTQYKACVLFSITQSMDKRFTATYLTTQNYANACCQNCSKKSSLGEMSHYTSLIIFFPAILHPSTHFSIKWTTGRDLS